MVGRTRTSGTDAAVDTAAAGVGAASDAGGVAETARRRVVLFVAGWRRPVYRDGMALISSSALSSLVGLLYWVLAARLYPPAQVGVGSALVATLMLLGSVGGLNLGVALLRFVPVAGASARSLVAGCYAAAAVVAACVGVAFAVGARWWSPELVAPLGRAGLIAFLGVAAPVWAVFVMQDYVLTALGRAVLVPVANLAFALVKVGLLAAAAVLAVPAGIALSWMVATALLVVAVMVGLVRLLAVPGPAGGSPVVEPVDVRVVARFVRADYAGELCWTAVVFGLPVLVLTRLGAEAAATFGVVWTIAYGLYLVSHGMGQSLVAHLAADPAGLATACRGMTLRAFSLLVPAVVVLGVGARPLLALFGPHYAATGGPVLILAALSALPDVVIRAATVAARVRRRQGVLVGLPAVAAAQILVGAWFLAPRLGLVGVGVALLGAQTVTAVGVLAVRRLAPST